MLAPKGSIAVLVFLVCLATATPRGHAQTVQLNLSGSVPLPQLLRVLGQQIGTQFLFSEELADRSVTVFTPAEVPVSAVPTLLGTLLKAENLAVVDSELPGFKRIVDFSDMTPEATIGQADEILRRDGPAAAVTQVIPVRNVDPATLPVQLKPFLSKQSNIIPLPGASLIIVTDYAQNVRTVAELLRIIDRPIDRGVIEFYQTRRRPASVLIDQVRSLLDGGGGGTSSGAKAGNASGTAGGAADFRLFNDASGGRVIIAASQARLTEILELLRRLDTGTDFETKLYRLQNVSAERIESLARQIAGSPPANREGGREGGRGGPPPESPIETTVDPEGNLLIVRASPEIHTQIRRLVEQLDVPVQAEQSPIRFYKLKNASANEVLLSLLSLQQATGVNPLAGGIGGFGGGFVPANFNTLGIGGAGLTGVGLAGVTPIGGGVNAGFGAATAASAGGFGGVGTGGLNRGTVGLGGSAINGNVNNFGSSAGANLNRGVAAAGGSLGLAGNLGLAGGLAGGAGSVATLPGGANISADVATNSLIVVAPANVQPLYQRLIESLDQRRPQVLVKADIVAVDTSNNFQLGVEVVFGDRSSTRRAFAFSQFGLSEVNALTGEVTAINNSLGFNGVVLDPDVADVVVQALSTNSRSRVLASPKILVNDNETGTLESVASVPFQTLGIGDTASVATLGGDQTAGTTISLTPQINENDFLKLAFEVEFSSFGAGGDGVLPPPRQIDRIGSVVTVPDNQTIVVGGLQQFNEADTFTGIPLLERIPVLRELSSRTTASQSSTSFFLFIRPTILRDSGFRDLQYLSDVDAAAAMIPGDAPEARPILIENDCGPAPVHTIVSEIDGEVCTPIVDPPSEFDANVPFDSPPTFAEPWSSPPPTEFPNDYPMDYMAEPISDPILIPPR